MLLCAIGLFLLQLLQAVRYFSHQQKIILLKVPSFSQEGLSTMAIVITICEEFCQIGTPKHSEALYLSSIST